MGSLLRFNLSALREAFKLDRLVETGTGKGASLDWAARCGFSALYSVELSAPLYLHSTKRFANNSAIHLEQGESLPFLQRMIKAPASPLATLYFLDAHFLGGADFDLTSYAESARNHGSFPLLDELDVILGSDLSSSVMIMDDIRMYFDGAFQNGECPGFARRWEDRSALRQRMEQLAATHNSHLLREDEGYLVVVPKSVKFDRASWINILPYDSSGSLTYLPGVPGVSSISMQRRLHDSRFATRYFRGYGIDVGGGADSLALYKEFFPLIRNVFVYDQPHGDAQMLANVFDNSFDFLYSSHCLEHLCAPAEALENWLRVVRPGGYLVVNVPDEDLYEQGEWPSRFNSDHKLTFTIAKPSSWSPVSVDLLHLLSKFRDQAEVLSIQRLDQGYRFESLPRGIDQTRTPMAECGIEFILRKRKPV